MKNFMESILKFRKITYWIVFLITVLSIYGVLKLKTNTDITSYLSEEDPIVKTFNKVGDEFGSTSIAMIGIEAEDIFNTNVLKDIKLLTEEYQKIKGVKSVTSILNMMDIKKTETGIEVSDLIDKDNIPKTEEELKKLKIYVLSNDDYRGKIISSDGKITLIIVKIRNDIKNKEQVAEKIRTLTKKLKLKEKIYFGGMPFQMIESRDLLFNDVKKLIPLTLIIIIIFLYISFKSKRYMFLSLTTVLLATLWTVGLMGIFHIEFPITGVMIPIILISAGSAYSIHMLHKYNEVIQDEMTKKEKIIKGASEVSIPIIFAAITTIIGFLSLLTSSLTAIKNAGIFISVGISFAVLISIFFLPPILLDMKVKKIKREGESSYLFSFLLKKLDVLIKKNYKIIIFFTGIIVIISIFAMFRITREVNMEEYFSENSDIRITETMMRKKFGGSIPLLIYIKGEINHPATLSYMNELKHKLCRIENLKNVQSVADIICELNEKMNDVYGIPQQKDKIDNLWFFVEGREWVKQFVNKDKNEAVIQGMLETIDTKKVINIVKEVDNILKKTDNTYYKIKNNKKNSALIIANNITAKYPKINTNELIKKLNDFYKNYKLSIKDKQKIKKEIKRYLLSDDSEIELPKSTINKIIKDLEHTSFNNIDEVILKNISQNIRKENNEEIEGLILSIKDIVKNITVNKINKKLSMPIYKYLKENKINVDKKDKKDIEGFLYLVGEPTIWIKEGEYKKYNLADKVLDKVSIYAEQTGMPKIFKKLDKELIMSQLTSLFVALLMIFIIMALNLKSIVLGLISTIPVTITILVNFAIMGIFNIPLDNATMMIASIAIGIGIDYTIHFISRLKLELKDGKNILQVLEKVVHITGNAILINAVSVSSGFFILMGSELVPMKRFGWLSGLTMYISSFAAIIILPSFLLLFHKLMERRG